MAGLRGQGANWDSSDGEVDVPEGRQIPFLVEGPVEANSLAGKVRMSLSSLAMLLPASVDSAPGEGRPVPLCCQPMRRICPEAASSIR
jgi:hypothetical protein